MFIGTIEKEIKQEHKVFWGLTMRQAISCVVVCVPIFFLNMGVEMPVFARVTIAAVAGLFLLLFAFKKYSGMTFECYFSKKIKRFVYKNSIRFYRTRNAYITTLNTVYKRMQTADSKDKKKSKYIKKTDKKQAKRRKKSKIKAYA